MPDLSSKPQDVGVIVALITKATERVPQLGKTQLQKLVYFLQESGVPLGFKYVIYHYGPYSFDLSNAMDTLDTLRVINIDTDPAGYGFHIRLGQFSSKFRPSTEYAGKIDEMLARLGDLRPADLEVKATLHFVRKVLEKRGNADRSAVVEKVKALKPRFDREFIEECYDNMSTNGLMD